MASQMRVEIGVVESVANELVVINRLLNLLLSYLLSRFLSYLLEFFLGYLN